MKRVWIMMGLILAGCNSSAAPEKVDVAEIETPQAPLVEDTPAKTQQAETTLEEGVTFSDVLEDYRAINSRLEQVAYRLKKANRPLCDKTSRSLGFTVHTAWDYPENLRDIARALLPVSDSLSVRTIRDGSPASQAGLMAGDQLIRLGDTYFPRGQTASRFYEIAAPQALAETSVDLIISRDGERRTMTAAPETLCGYPVNVFFSEHINGHTDGEEVWITSELMRSVPDDVNLALVVAHEMAHAMAGHMAMQPGKRLELEADRMALIMLARAGYDIDRAISYWAQAQHPHSETNYSATHPSIQERLTHFQAVREEINARRKAGMDLKFNQ